MQHYYYPRPLRHTHFLHVAEWLRIEFCLTFSTYHSVTYRKGQYYVYSYRSGNVVRIDPDTVFSPSFHPSHYALSLSSGISLPAWLFNSEFFLRSALSELTNDTLLAAFKNLHLDTHDTNISISRHGMIMYIIEFIDAIAQGLSNCSSLDDAVIFLYTLRHNYLMHIGHSVCCLHCLLKDMFGDTLYNLLRRPQLCNYVHNAIIDEVAPHFRITVDAEKSFLDKHCVDFRKKDLIDIIQNLHPSRRPTPVQTYEGCALAILHSFQQQHQSLYPYATYAEIHQLSKCYDPHRPYDKLKLVEDEIYDLLCFEYTSNLVSYLLKPFSSYTTSNSLMQKAKRRKSRLVRVFDDISFDKHVSDTWPSLPDEDIILKCADDYQNATNIKVPLHCACCSRTQHGVEVQSFSLKTVDKIVTDLNLNLLYVYNETLRPYFQFDYPQLCGLMLDADAFTNQNNDCFINFCSDCLLPLKKNKLPRFALANHLYRGVLPMHLQDLTWIEEMVCAIYRNTAYVTRLYQSSDPAQPRVFKGNTCAHEMNVVSTATVLPRTPSDINDMLSIVFIGAGRYLDDCLAAKFRIRKQKVWDFLIWLRANNPLYCNIPLSVDNLSMYPEDGILPHVENRVILNEKPSDRDIFQTETAGLSDHPAEQVEGGSDSQPSIFLEHMGVTDPDCVRLEGRTFTASALRNLIVKPDNKPDLVIHHGRGPVTEYNNPNLFPGMYPILFPLGQGGFEDPERRVKLGFQPQAMYFMDLKSKLFTSHHSFLFVALNIYHRRLAHIYTSLTVSSTRFNEIAEELISISPSTLQFVAKHLEQSGRLADLTPEQQKVMNLLKHVNTVSGKIPGSEASRLTCRNEILSYCSMFGIPTLYFTANPNPSHSPMFQVLWGDTTVNLAERFPNLVNATERAMRLAQDPVAAADFFDMSIKFMFENLFGWDYARKKSKRQGGIFGHMRAFYGTTEYTDRGSLHGHFMIWLLGAPNPSVLHMRLKEEHGLDERLFTLFDNTIHHHVPDIGVETVSNYEPRIERPPLVPDISNCTIDDIRRWKSAFDTDVKQCDESLQRHKCRPVCHKYGNDDKCRFHFPHEYEPKSYFDVHSNSIIFRCLDPTINFFNPFILVFCRHNHDLRCLLSGKAAKAAMFYITDYITKGDLKTHHLLSLLSKGVINAQNTYTEEKTALEKSKALLHKCLSQFSQQRQVHAQQAARYLRGRGDSIQSHETVPMLTSALLSFVKKTYHCHSISLVSQENLSESEHEERQKIRITVDEHGHLQRATQIEHYYYRDDALKNVTFFDFVSRFKLEKTQQPLTNTIPRLGTYHRFPLLRGHPLMDTHCIVEVVNVARGDGLQPKIPRVIGCSIPRPTSEAYQLFMLSHFKPFSINNALIPTDKTVASTFAQFVFDPESIIIMENWEVMHECEDERDAERIRKRVRVAKDVEHVLQTEIALFEDSNSVATLDPLPIPEQEQPFEQNKLLLQLKGCNYFAHTSSSNLHGQRDCPELPVITSALLGSWKSQTKQQELQLAQKRRQPIDHVHGMPFVNNVRETENAATLASRSSERSTYVPPTETIAYEHVSDITHLLSEICQNQNLNVKQSMAFYIIARAFFR